MDSNHTSLALSCLDSALKKDGNYYPQVFLKVIRHIHNNLSYFSSSDEPDEE